MRFYLTLEGGFYHLNMLSVRSKTSFLVMPFEIEALDGIKLKSWGV